jgi:integrase
MSLFTVNGIYYYNFQLNGHRYSRSTRKTREKDALEVEAAARRLLLNGHQGVLQQEQRERERQTIAAAADAFIEDYTAKHQAPGFAEYDLGRVKRLIGHLRILEVTPDIVKRYQHDRLKEDAAPKTVNDEVGLLLRLCGDQGDAIRGVLKRTKSLKLKLPPSPGRPFEADEQTRMLAVARASTLAAREACLRQARGERAPRGAKQGGSPCIYPALVIALNCGMRDSEIRLLTWDQIDLEKQFLTVGRRRQTPGPAAPFRLTRPSRMRSWSTRAGTSNVLARPGRSGSFSRAAAASRAILPSRSARSRPPGPWSGLRLA